MTTQANITNIETMIAFFEGFDKHHKIDMDNWTHPCGAPSCLAGYAVAQLDSDNFDKASALSKTKIAFQELYDTNLLTYAQWDILDDQHKDMCHKVLQTNDITDYYPNRAGELLGMSEDEINNTFFPDGDYWEKIKDKTKAKNAVKVLKMLLADVTERMKTEGETENTVFTLPTAVATATA